MDIDKVLATYDHHIDEAVHDYSIVDYLRGIALMVVMAIGGGLMKPKPFPNFGEPPELIDEPFHFHID